MQSLIDWLSISLPVQNEYPAHRARGKVGEAMGSSGITDIIPYTPDNWKLSGGRAPYSGSYRDNGIAIFFGKPQTILVEIEGQGCARLETQLEELLRRFSTRVTRIDIAADMTCQTDPQVFCEYADAKRMRSSGVIRSDSGVTVYIGSRKSDRYCRVYRYSPPHPRSDTLRVEMVFRGVYAKTVADFVARHGITEAVTAYGDTYGFKHPEWTPEVATSGLVAAIPAIRRSQNNTVRWLIMQAAPAFRKCVEHGSIDDPQAFINQHFIGG